MALFSLENTKKTPASEGSTSPLRHLPCVAQVLMKNKYTSRHWCAVTSKDAVVGGVRCRVAGLSRAWYGVVSTFRHLVMYFLCCWKLELSQSFFFMSPVLFPNAQACYPVFWYISFFIQFREPPFSFFLKHTDWLELYCVLKFQPFLWDVVDGFFSTS